MNVELILFLVFFAYPLVALTVGLFLGRALALREEAPDRPRPPLRLAHSRGSTLQERFDEGSILQENLANVVEQERGQP